MVALDGAVGAPSQTRFNVSAISIAAGLLGAVCAVGVPLALDGYSYEGWTLAARSTDEFAGLLLVIAFLAAPLARLFRGNEMLSEHRRLALGFVAAYAVHLVTGVYAATAEGQRIGAPVMAGVAVQFAILIALAAAAIWSLRGWPGVSRRIHSVAVWFFWLTYTFACLGHYVGPHIADSSYGAGLAVLLAALFARFFADLIAVWSRPLAEKVG